MRTHVLRIIAINLLGVCLLCCLTKMAMKNENSRKTCDNACGVLIFIALALIGVSQIHDDNEKYDSADGCLPSPPSKYGCEMCKCAVPLDWSFSGCGKFCNYKDSCPDEDDPNKNKNSNKFCWLPVRENKCTNVQFNCSSTEGPTRKKSTLIV